MASRITIQPDGSFTTLRDHLVPLDEIEPGDIVIHLSPDGYSIEGWNESDEATQALAQGVLDSIEEENANPTPTIIDLLEFALRDRDNL